MCSAATGSASCVQCCRPDRPDLNRVAPLTSHFVRANLRFVETYESVLEALGDRTRRQIIASLKDGPASVGELAGRLPVSRPAISQHLQVLHRSRLVTYQEFGTRNVYRLDTAGLHDLDAWLDGFWQNALGRFAEHVRQDKTRRKLRRRQH